MEEVSSSGLLLRYVRRALASLGTAEKMSHLTSVLEIHSDTN